jgi:transportin-1
MIPHNPLGIKDSFPYFCEALVEFKDTTPELERQFQSLIETFKNCYGEENWNSYINDFPPSLKNDIISRFSHGQQKYGSMKDRKV